MKYPLALLCFLFLYTRVSAQHTEDSSRQVSTHHAGDSSRQATARLKASMSALSRTTIRFRTPGNTSYPGLFNHFEVIDERADTARIGIRAMTGPFSHNHQRQLVFGRPVAAEIAEYLNGHFSRQGAPFTALVVLRTLWLSDANYIREDLVKDPDKKLDNFQIRLKAEVYAGKDSLYMPVFRYDTLVTTKNRDYNSLQTPFSALQSYYPLMEAGLSDLFIDLADSASLVAGRKMGNGRKVSRDEIREFNRSRFTVPVDNGAVYAPGVYASFEEFRNNAPSIHDFEIKTEKKDILLYIKDAAGTSYYSHDAWGYSDGVSLFVMRDGILWPAWKEGKAIYFYGLSDKIKTVQGQDYNPGTPGYTTPGGKVVSGTPAYSAPYTTTEKEKVKCIYTVDMDSGEVY
jgi:hypothetical protein